MHIQTLEEVMQPYQHYPKVIQQALLRVETHPSFASLTKASRKVLKALLTRASKTDGRMPIKARVDRVAIESGVSDKSVQRAIAVLRKVGWLAQLSDGRSKWGAFTSRIYQFSSELCELTQLPIKGKTCSQETEMSDGVYIDLNFKKDQQEISQQNRQENPAAHPITLPAELQPIIDMGVKASGVCKLRGMAHARGHKLSDIYLVAKKRLTELKASGNRVYRYLAAMIANPKATDYAARASQAERNSIDTEAVAQTRDCRALYANKRFAAGPGRVVKIFDGIAEVSQDGAWVNNIAGRDMDAVYDAIDNGTLREIAG